MKLSFCLLALFLATSASVFASEPLDVQLNNPAFRSTVKSFLDSKRIQYRFVNKIEDGASYLKISVTEDLSHGASCALATEANRNGMTETGNHSRSTSFVFHANAHAYCLKAVAEMLSDSSEWIL